MASKSVCVLLRRRLSSAAAAVPLSASHRSHRNAVFSREQSRQRALFPRVEKVEVSLQGPGVEGTLLVMNRGTSTPLSCARRVSGDRGRETMSGWNSGDKPSNVSPLSCVRDLTEYHVESSVLALVDGELWPLHKPLTDNCTLSLLTFKDKDPTAVNKAYWRSCSALLGQVLETAFKEDFRVELLPSVQTPVSSGAFCCDVVLDPQLDSWTASEESLRSLTRAAQLLIQQNLPLEPLDVLPAVALEVFSHSKCKQEEVEKMAAESPRGTVQLYRCGDHVLLSSGPLVARTGLCSQYEVTALHSLGHGPWGLHRRLQGLSLPTQLQAHHTVWRKLRKRAEKLVEVPAPDMTLATSSAPSQSAASN